MKNRDQCLQFGAYNFGMEKDGLQYVRSTLTYDLWM